MPIARDLMTQTPATVLATDPVRKAVTLMRAFDVRHMPVVDEDGALVGILSDRDLRALTLPWLVADELAAAIEASFAAPVSAVMSSDVLSVNTEDDVRDIVDIIIEHRIGAVPVIDNDGILVGTVSYVDVLRAWPSEGEAAA